jgi:hypothetical protein
MRLRGEARPFDDLGSLYALGRFKSLEGGRRGGLSERLQRPPRA